MEMGELVITCHGGVTVRGTGYEDQVNIHIKEIDYKKLMFNLRHAMGRSSFKCVTNKIFSCDNIYED